ncbi:MAG: hypothetical protein K9K66_10320 [Desulfarculaceae bacterium]|nr:hypothetical protein [Desulfarculaceae bacterium]MCF8073803.1 hypothetical protein [Desulfarculaceae bacterium]MCF8102044.1 hypothetical protein [Desulfarculaceae bacterium]MCF8116014.1 hypothetical protein [Desulfarculaceae bacterium]
MTEPSQTESPGPEAAPPPSGLPWEAPGAGIREFFLSMYGIMARPSWALSAPPGGAWPRWAGFALIMWFVVFIARYLLSWAWSMGDMGGPEMLLWGILGMLIQAAVFLPLYSGAVYLTINLLLRGRPAPPYPLVLRAVCYSQVSTAAMLIPMVGIFAHMIWNVWLMAVGLRAGLGIDRRTALLGVILPMVGFFVLGMLLASLGLAVQ